MGVDDARQTACVHYARAAGTKRWNIHGVIRRFSRITAVSLPFARASRARLVSGSAALTVDSASAQALSTERSTAGRAERRTGLAGRSLNVSLETLLWGVVVALTLVSRFWDLSSRAQNHDESLHAYFSWLLFDDYHYLHDPLMHGPFLFHSNALLYFLFGDNDYTSRVLVAILGTIVVLLPWLLRGPNLLGRWGALSASALLLLSPSILYYSRFIRHDIPALIATMLIVIGLFRFLDKPDWRWIALTGISTGWLFCTKEVSFIVAFILLTFVGFVLGWQIHKGLLIIAGFTGLALGLGYVGLSAYGVSELPGIPWNAPTTDNINDFLIQLMQHPVTLLSLGILGLGAVAMLMLLDRVRHRVGAGWVESVFGQAPPDTTTHTVYLALRDKRGWQLGLAGGLVIFIALYTTFFTNIAGLLSGTAGALGYWLGQHSVQRAEQPWFYYLILAPQYEYVAALLFPIAAVITLKRLIPRIRRGEPVGRRLYFQTFLLYWAFMMLAVLSWAGEKMPWLMVHFAAPMILFAASYIGEAIEHVEALVRARRLPRWSAFGVAIGVPLIAGWWFLIWAWGTAGPYVQLPDTDIWVRTLRPEFAERPWLFYLPLLALLGLVAFGVTRLGWRRLALVGGVSAVLVLSLGQLHALYRFTYVEGDVPRDMLMYSQVSPDVPRVMEELGAYSRETTGGLDISVAYDSGVSWPFQWYLRNYPNRSFYGSELSSPPDADVVLISQDSMTPENLAMLTGYTYQEYTMRWFYPEEETYRRFAIAPELNEAYRQNYQTDEEGPYSVIDVAESILSSFWSLRDIEQQAYVFRLAAFRELPVEIYGNFEFRVYVRNDLIDTYNQVRYLP